MTEAARMVDWVTVLKLAAVLLLAAAAWLAGEGWHR